MSVHIQPLAEIASRARNILIQALLIPCVILTSFVRAVATTQ